MTLCKNFPSMHTLQTILLSCMVMLSLSLAKYWFWNKVKNCRLIYSIKVKWFESWQITKARKRGRDESYSEARKANIYAHMPHSSIRFDVCIYFNSNAFPLTCVWLILYRTFDIFIFISFSLFLGCRYVLAREEKYVSREGAHMEIYIFTANIIFH